MNWNEVRKHNRKASARKANREQAEAARAVAIVAMGGPFAIEELRAAEVKVVELPRQYVGITDPHVVWTMRGKEWLVGFDFGNEAFGMMLLSDRHNSRYVAPSFKSAAANEMHAAYEAQREANHA